MKNPRVIIIGGGFGGINTAIGLRRAPMHVMLIDKTNHHLFQPLLYQVASAALSIDDISTSLREIFLHQKNVEVIMDDVLSIDKDSKTIRLLHGEPVAYDYLVVATGSTPYYFGHNEWATFAQGLKTLADAIKLREHILWSFELAERAKTHEEAHKHLRFVVIGGGPTGVELAGAIAETALTPIFKNFKNVVPRDAEIYLIEGGPRILPSYPEKLSQKATEDLQKMGINVICNQNVTNITQAGVYIGDRLIETPNVIWAAGNRASPLVKSLHVPLDRQGRVKVQPDLSVEGYPELFVIGDTAACEDLKFGTLPGVAPVAMQQGKYVAKIISQQIPKDQRKSFKYHDKGSMATIGKAKAVAQLGKWCFSGLFAWLIWCFIHVAYLVSFRNRFIVMSQWMFLYLANRRNVCIITHSVDEIDEKKEKGDDKQT